MTRAQRNVLVLAGLLIAARLFFPIEACTPPADRWMENYTNCQIDSSYYGILRTATAVTLLHALGIVTLAGVAFVVLSRSRSHAVADELKVAHEAGYADGFKVAREEGFVEGFKDAVKLIVEADAAQEGTVK